jgi:GWxTD domain-containing protein
MPLMRLYHCLIAILCLITIHFTSCKTYEKAGGVNMMSRFNNCARDLPSFFTLQHISNDSSLIHIALKFSEYNPNKSLPSKILLYGSAMKDVSNSDKYIWPPIIDRSLSKFEVSTRRDTILKLSIPILRNEKGWLQVKLYSSDSVIYFKQIIPFDKAYSGNDAFFVVKDAAGSIVHPRMLNRGNSYYINHFSNTDTLFSSYFPFYPTPAAPIFFQNANAGLPAESDTLFRFSTKQPIVFNWSGLYEIRRPYDSSGLQLLVHDNNFPELETALDLIEPLRYISKNEEYNKLLKAQDFKLQLDSFWIARCGSAQLAKQSIKLYYNRIEFVNRHFTSYRAGWKTDPGLVYIMFGAPQKCYKFKAGEIWTYTNLPTQTEFVFLERRNQYCTSWLELKREQEYINLWNGQSYKWRTGKMINEPQ